MSEDTKLIGKMGMSALIYLTEKIKGDGENIVEIVKDYTDGKVADEQQRAEGVEDELVKSVVIYYALGTSETTAPTSGWSTQAPPHEAGKYMWQKTVTTKNDETASTTTTCIQGADGQSGTSITISSIQYQAGDSATTAPTGSWSNTPVSVPEGQYLWTKTVFSDDSIAYGIARQGVDGSSPSYSEEEPASPPAHSLWVKTSTGDIYIYENGEWIPLTTEYITGPELDDGIVSKVYETFYAYADDSIGSGFSLVETGKQYRGIYTTASGIQSNDYRDYVWELNPLWASQVASNYISEQSGGLKILTPDAKTYAGLTGLALAFYLGGIEQARLGYLFEGETKAAYGVIAQDIFAFGSGAGIKFDNSNQSNARGRFTWEIRDNGHLSLKKY